MIVCVTHPIRLFMSSVCGMDENIGLETLESMGKQRAEVCTGASSGAGDRIRTYSLRYTSSAPSNGPQRAGIRASQNGPPGVLSTPQASTFHEMDNADASRST